jgi:hypothetical protein
MPNPDPPFTGYVPRFEMPIIAPPPSTYQGAALDYYQQLQLDLGLAMSGPNGEFVDFTLTKAANATSSAPIDATLFAMTGGFVRYYPANLTVPSPDGFTAPADGVIELGVWLDDVLAQQRAFPPDTPSISRIYYVGVDLDQTTALLQNETAKMSDAALRASWKTQLNAPPPDGTTHDQLVDQHNGCVMAGLASVFVDAGTPIGKAAQDSAAPVETYLFTLRMTDSGPPMTYVSPLPSFIGAPYYDL